MWLLIFGEHWSFEEKNVLKQEFADEKRKWNWLSHHA
jgi:hypothetical protein